MKSFYGTAPVATVTVTVTPRVNYIHESQLEDNKVYLATWINKDGVAKERLLMRKDNIVFSFRPAGEKGQHISKWDLNTEAIKFNQSYTTLQDVSAKFSMLIGD